MRRYSTRRTYNQNLQGLTLSEQFKEIQRQAMEDANNLRPRVQLNNQNIPENVNLINEEKQIPQPNDNDISNNDNLGNDPNPQPNNDPLLNLRANDDDIPSIPSDGSQNNETGNGPENDYKSDDGFEHFTSVNTKQKVVTDKLQMMEERINQIEDNINSVKEELKNSLKESINQIQQQFMIMMKDMMQYHQKSGDTENTNKSPTSFTIQTPSIQVENTTYADQKTTTSEFTIKLVNFDGDKKISFDTWMKKFEIFVEENHIPPHKHFKILKYHLGEDPASAIRDCKDFDEAVKILQENYNGEVSIATANSLLNSIKRKRVRSLDDIKKYTPTIEEAYKALYKVKQARMIHQINFLKDMLSPELQLHFHGTTTNDWPLFLCQVKDKITLLKKAKEDQEFSDKIRKKKKSKDNAKKERKCTFEGCRYPNSHETKDCKFKKGDYDKKTLLCNIVDKGKVKEAKNKSDKYNEGLTIIHGKINNIDAKVAIDTGSNVSILNSNWLNKLNLQVDKGNESTIDNLNSKSTLKRCKGEIIITLNEVDFKLNNPHVFVNDEYTFDLLLGSDILMKTKGFYISYDDNKFIKFKLLKNDNDEIKKDIKDIDYLNYFQKMYPTCFAKTDRDLTPFLQAEKQLIYENIPINPKYPSYPLGEYAQIIEEGVARINHPVIIVKKANAPPDGTVHEKYRFVTDLRHYHDLLKEIINQKPLSYGNINERYYLHTDASDQGIGSCIFQKSKIYVLKDTDETIPEEDIKNYRSDEIEEREIDKIIAFYSAKLNKVNKRRHSTYLELKSIADSLDYFSYLLSEAKGGITVVTDHLPLKKLMLTGGQRKYIELIHRIDPYNIQLEFTKGKSNVIPDWFSRIKENPEEEERIKCFMAKRGRPKKKPPTIDDDKEKIELPSIKESAETDPLKKRRELLKEIFRLSHDQHGHFGYKKTHQLIKDRMVDDKLQVNDTILNDWEDDLKIYIKSCKECQLRNINMKRHGKDQTVKMEAPNLHISVDIIGPLNQKSYQNHKYILSIMDDFSRYTYAVPITDYHFSTISKELLHYFCLFGYPKIIKSDQGGNFLSDELNQWLSSLNITHEYTKAYHKKGNSLVERAHRWIEDGISKSSRNNPTHWNEYIDNDTFAYNSTKNETSGRSPFSCMFLREPVIPLDNHLHTYSVGLHDKSNDLYQLYKIAAETHFDTNQLIEGTRNKENQKTNDNRLPAFKKNDLILIRRPDNKPKIASKFKFKYKGPYRVIRQEGNNVIYKMSNRGKEIYDNVENIKRYYQRDKNLEETSDSEEKEEKDYDFLVKKKIQNK
uniref:Integrase catalytic domain-containing protein n=1 Tax=Strongyloides venezuelensis TaxID=75913 RepID=A0A0K0EZV3_STRVS